MQARASCSSEISPRNLCEPSQSLHTYDISLRPYSAQPPLDLELSSLDRMHTRTMFPAAMQPVITDPIMAIVVYGGWAESCTPTATQIPERFLRYPTREPSYWDKILLVRTGQSPFRCRREMRSCTRRTDEKSPHAPTAGTHRIWISTIGQASSHAHCLSRAAGQLESTSLFWEVGRVGWKQQRNFRASIEEPYLSMSAATLPVRFLQPVASQFNATSSESRKIAWRMYPTTTTHHVASTTLLEQPVRILRKYQMHLQNAKICIGCTAKTKHAGTFSFSGEKLEMRRGTLYTAVQRPKQPNDNNAYRSTGI
ncbi:hypothetical protein N431DRAFT_531088 [Stipitochalara longipes BDJ]|nr:hypothetical protein N431DRAFT_531088 [Stipitochalara longipes BDJ]